MDNLTAWASFVGAWLLFAGAIYQAALELQEQDIETERIRATGRKIDLPHHVSAWWWLVPPVKLVLERRRSKEYRKAHIKALLDEDVEALTAFFNKATAWVYVATGGFLIAVNETYGVVQEYGWNDVFFWIIIVTLGLISILNTVLRISRTKKIIEFGKN